MSRYKFDATDILVAGYKYNALQWRGPGLSPVTKLSWVQEQSAKLVTNLLILLSVLCGRSNFIIVLQKTDLMLIVNLFVICYLFYLFLTFGKIESGRLLSTSLKLE